MTIQTIKKDDFVEIEFTGIAKEEKFDTTNPDEATQSGIEDSTSIKPLIISVGNQMLLKGLDQALEGKEINKKYSIQIQPEQAFGKRNPSLIKTISMKIFREKNMNPVPGMAFQLDQSIVRILSVSGGRVIVDFNNPLAGKEVEYNFKINKRITEPKEKINALQDFFFKQKFEFTLQDKKVLFKIKDEKFKPLIELMKDKFKEISGFEIGVEGQTKEKEEKPSEPPNNQSLPSTNQSPPQTNKSLPPNN